MRPALALGAGQDTLPNVRKGVVTLDEALTPWDDVTTYNNFYEFGMDKDDPARNSKKFRTKPWTVKIDGLVNKPGDYQLEDLVAPHALEERIYRLRCVEAWSMVIPWVGFPLADLIKRAEPQGSAKFVEFTTLLDPRQMPGQRLAVLDWPYVEGLRLDEAMHPLTILAVRPLREGAAEPERRAASPGGALEVRLQEHQVDRAHPLHGEAADVVVEGRRRRRSTASTPT